MSLENSTVTVEVPETDNVSEAKEIAGEIVETAKDLAETMRGESNFDRVEILGRIEDLTRRVDSLYESNDARHTEIIARLDEIRSAQIVDAIRMDAVEDTIQDVIEDEVEDTEAAPVSVNVSQASDGSAIEKETVISDAPAVAEERANKKTGRVWL